MLGIRPYKTGDSETIVNWCKDEKAFYKWSAGILGEYPLTSDRMEKFIKEKAENDYFFPFVAYDENGIVGYFILRQPSDKPDELRFGFIIVSPEIRGKGYGKKMLELGLKFAFEIYGAKKASLGVFENNESAYYCYKAVCFKESGITETYQINGEAWKCIVMEICK